MNAPEPAADDAPEERPSVRLVDGLFELATTIIDKGGRPYTTKAGKPSPPRVRAVFGISDHTISLWRTEHLDRNGIEAPLKFTEKLIEIFSEKYKAHVPDGYLDEADLIYRFWESDCGSNLQKAKDALEDYAQVLEQRNAAVARQQKLAQLETEIPGATRRSSTGEPGNTFGDVRRPEPGTGQPASAEAFAARARKLELTLKPAISRDARKNLFLRRPDWDLVCRDAYARRSDLLTGLVKRFEDFYAKRQSAIDQLKLPIFWIGGRSGDGKSVLLLQLARELLSRPNPPVILWCNSPDDLMLLVRAPEDLPRPLILAVDDLHKAIDWDAATAAIERAANSQCDLVLLTCGPTPERSAFLNNKTELVAATKFDTPNVSQADAAVFGEHLRIQIDASNAKAPTLVEQLYWALGGNRDLTAFAKSLHNRVDSPVGQEGLLAELVALTWMDVPFPADRLDPIARSRIEELANETQLHFEEIPNGYRFGHPAIAKPIFDALTAAPGRNVSLALRLARTLSLVLPKMADGDRRRALRQIAPRLARDADLTPVDVLMLLHQSAGGPVLGADVALMLLGLFPPNVAGQLKWVIAARTFRDNNSIEPKVRAQFATQLALREPPDDQDVRVALQLTEHSDIGPHMEPMIIALIDQKKGKISRRLLPYAVKWANRNADETGSFRTTEALLSNYHHDRRVRHLALRMIATTDLKSLRLKIVLALAKYMEQESEQLVRHWMHLHRGTPQAGEVIRGLLTRPGSRWIDEAIEWLGPSAQPDTHWAQMAAEVLRRVSDDHPFVSKAKQWATTLEQLEEGGPIFEALAERAGELEAIDLIEKRLMLRWGARDAIRTFAKLWPHLPVLTDLMQQRLREIVESAVLVSTATARSERALIDDVMTALSIIASTKRYPEFWIPPCIDFLQVYPNCNLSGSIAGRILSLLATLRAQSLPSQITNLVETANFFVNFAWQKVEDENSANAADRASALMGLVRLQWLTETSRLRGAINSFLFPKPHFVAAGVVGVWLSVPESSAEAMAYLLDDSIDEEQRFRCRAGAAARNLQLIFDEMLKPISEQHKTTLCRLLGYGIGDFTRSPGAAWAAWSHYESWPQFAIAYLWRGVLRSSLEGFTMRRDIFWREFESWFQSTKDAECRSILENASLYPVQHFGAEPQPEF